MTVTKRKILIIEDDPVISSVYKTRFEKAGYEVEVALDGQTGFYRVLESKPTAVLLDLMLPQMSGLDILKKIRAQKLFQKLPVFVFTNAFMSDMASDALDAGANEVFNKATSSPQQIVESIENSFTRRAPGHWQPHAMPPSEAGLHPAAYGWPGQNGYPPPGQAYSPPMQGHPSQTNYSPPPKTVGGSNGRSAYADYLASKSAQQKPPPHSPGAFNKEASSPSSGRSSQDLKQTFRDSFGDKIEERMANMRSYLQATIKATTEEQKTNYLNELTRIVHSITGSGGVAGLKVVAHFASALEALLRELFSKPDNINSSSIRTLASAIDFLGKLMQEAENRPEQDFNNFNILVVEDEVMSRKAVVRALEKAGLKCLALEKPALALQLLEENQFDLIFLDVDMPEVNGFDLCTRVRESELNKTTPVIFVTGLTDFDNRAKSTLTGGNDFIGKPFPFFELGVKALIHLLRENRSPPRNQSTEIPEPGSDKTKSESSPNEQDPQQHQTEKAAATSHTADRPAAR